MSKTRRTAKMVRIDAFDTPNYGGDYRREALGKHISEGIPMMSKEDFLIHVLGHTKEEVEAICARIQECEAEASIKEPPETLVITNEEKLDVTEEELEQFWKGARPNTTLVNVTPKESWRDCGPVVYEEKETVVVPNSLGEPIEVDVDKLRGEIEKHSTGLPKQGEEYAEVTITPLVLCSSCKGTGQYIGLVKTETCSECKGLKWVSKKE